jgi:hypothetical protein
VENGYFKSLKEFVHFYNTRDTLPHCAAGSPGEGVTCWPVPEVPRNLNTTCCDLGLTDRQEDDLVAFLLTLTDGYFAPKAVPGRHTVDDVPRPWETALYVQAPGLWIDRTSVWKTSAEGFSACNAWDKLKAGLVLYTSLTKRTRSTRALCG